MIDMIIRGKIKNSFKKAKKHLRNGSLIDASFKKIENYHVFRDIRNKIKYGLHAPIYCERIYINPLGIRVIRKDLEKTKHFILSPELSSGRVVSEDWLFKQSRPVKSLKILNFCIEHWVNGVSWENTGIFEFIINRIISEGIRNNISTIKNQMVKNYRELDKVFNQIKKEGRMKTRQELVESNFREKGGVIIHIGPNVKPYFMGDGNHRIAIAYILGLKEIPAQIGCAPKCNSFPPLF